MWIVLLSLTTIIFAIIWVQAEYVVYDNKEDFEKAKWEVCEAATDGCNNYFLVDGKVAWWTLKLCMDHTPEWTCTKYKTWVVTTKMMPVEPKSTVLTDNEKNLYDSIKLWKLEDNYVNKVEEFANVYFLKMSKMSDIIKKQRMDDLIDDIQKYTTKFILNIPADKKMTEKQARVYYVLKLLKFELMLLRG